MEIDSAKDVAVPVSEYEVAKPGVLVGRERAVEPPSYLVTEHDIAEGLRIMELQAKSTEAIVDPDRWLTAEPQVGVLTASLDKAVNWARRWSIWPAAFGLACCAMEMVASAALRFDVFARFGMEIMRASPRQADLLIISGTVTWKMSAALKMIYDQMSEPKWIIAMGSCAISGGPFADSYSVVPGVNRILPVDVYVPGCPPRPESLNYGIIKLHEKILKDGAGRS